ncbi:arginine--tRNA ligase [Flavobacteriaceae bacterium]|nr:arginine--tRNA ligase [Flavobacteriaceae bacterium]
MTIQEVLALKVKQAFVAIYKLEIPSVEFQATRKEFEGDITVVVFPMLRIVKGNPVSIGEALGHYLVDNVNEVVSFNVVKGFLNLVISDDYYFNFFNNVRNDSAYGFVAHSDSNDAVMVEYSSPNTNKPLHLGHVRNVLLGYSVSEIIKASGKKVYKTQIINDRGIHICKSMLAWSRFGNGETPVSTGLKGDKLVGNYYVKFDQEYKKEISFLIKEGKTEDEAKKEAPLIIEAQEMLRKWEAGDEKVVALWKKMNQWVYDGFEVTYNNIGVDFDSYYYESNTYLLGKDNIIEGLEKGVFVKKEDGSVWCDLTEDGLDEKIVLRSDGTSVYMTQDIGTAIQRIKDNPDVKGMIYTVGNEQDYHFKVLFLILKKLGYTWAENLHHLSYGMVDLPSGKMKSREGTVVDADDLMTEMISTSKEISEELGKLDDYTDAQKDEVYTTIGMGALKYFILKVDPKKRILFDPKESVDFQGNTGPFIQYTYARIQAILRKGKIDYEANFVVSLHEKEKELLKQIELYPEVIQQAAANQSPALIANYTYDLVKVYNSFFQNVSIFGADSEDEKIFRVQLSNLVGNIIKSAFGLLGITVPERM